MRACCAALAERGGRGGRGRRAGGVQVANAASVFVHTRAAGAASAPPPADALPLQAALCDSE